MDKKEVMSILDKSIDSSSLSINNETFSSSNNEAVKMNNGSNYTCWNYWQDYYYPQIIRESYPVYIGDRSKDSGKKAFEIIKLLADKKMVKLDKVKDFIDLMDTLIKIL